MSEDQKRPYTVEPDIAQLVERQANDAGRQAGTKPVFVMETSAVRRFVLETSVEGHRFLADEPIRGGGSDVGPAPLRYFVAGVVQCLEIWTIKLAALDKIPLTALSSTAKAFLEAGTTGVDALRSTDSLSSGRGFRQLDVTLTLDSELDETHDPVISELVRQAARACPAAATFARAAELLITPVHNGRALEAVR